MTKCKIPPSMATINEIKNSLIDACNAAHYRIKEKYGDTYHNETRERKSIISEKEKVILKISQEITEYAIKKYEKYGLIDVPLCRREGSKMNDRLDIELKVKVFPGIEGLVKADEKETKAYLKDMQRISDWYTTAITAVAKKELSAMPELPVFKPYGDIPKEDA